VKQQENKATLLISLNHFQYGFTFIDCVTYWLLEVEFKIHPQ